MFFVDSHCHLDRFQDLPGVLRRARESGVQQFLSIGVNRKNTQCVAALAQEYEDVYYSCGLHPCDVREDFSKHSSSSLQDYEHQLTQWLYEKCLHPKAVGLGETGLDFYKISLKSQEKNTQECCENKNKNKNNLKEMSLVQSLDKNVPQDQDLQLASLRAHCRVAQDLDLPLIIHMRQGEELFLEFMDQWQKKEKPLRGVMHCFTASYDVGQKILQWPHWYISLSGILTFPNAQDLRQSVQQFPLQRLLLETDAPWLAPKKYRGKTNEPQFLVETAQQLASLMGCSLDHIASETTKNFYDLFTKIPSNK